MRRPASASRTYGRYAGALRALLDTAAYLDAHKNRRTTPSGKINYKNTGLTDPAPSGMTRSQARSPDGRAAPHPGEAIDIGPPGRHEFGAGIQRQAAQEARRDVPAASAQQNVVDRRRGRALSDHVQW